MEETVFIPIHTPNKYSIGPLIICFLLIALFIGIGLYLYTKHHHNETPREVKEKKIKIHNKSQIKYTVKINGKLSTLSPNQITEIPIKLHENISISGYNLDGSLSEDNYKLSRGNITDLYITHSGIRSNLDGGKNVQLINESDYPILFIEVSDSNRKWISDIIPPKSNTTKEFLGRGVTIEVSHPTDENLIISTLTIGGKATQIIFDGHELRAY